LITVEANGAHIPALGFGTWELFGKEGEQAVQDAIEIGYRHFDTAQAYGNEADVGAAIAATGMRDACFLTTKIWPENYEPDSFRKAMAQSAEHLHGPADLVLLHWPRFDMPLTTLMDNLNWAREEGLARHIGVSNFPSQLLHEAARLSSAPLAANQMEYHPFLNQSRVLAACRELGVALTAYCPIARGRVFKTEVIAKIAKAHGKSAGQVTLRWLVQQEGVIAIPRTSSAERARENFNIFDFSLSKSEMAAIHGLADPAGRIVPDEEIREQQGLQSGDGHAVLPYLPEWDPVT
jgi:diketogulonate reductase-like aldo/keto reductase